MKTRSRGGCVACVQQHKKCNEARPACARCQRLAIECDYSVQLRWLGAPQLPRSHRRARRRRGDDASPPRLESSPPRTALPHDDGEVSDLEADRTCETSTVDYEIVREDVSDEATMSGALSQHLSTGRSRPKDLPDGCEDQQHVANGTGDQTSLLELMSHDIGSLIFDNGDAHQAYLYFVGCVAVIIPAYGTGSRNGYKQVARQALSSPVLLDTLVSVSTVYMQLRGIAPRSLALRRQSQALASLRQSIEALGAANECGARDTACLKRDLLATILLQVTVEMANGTSAIRTHIAYAFKLFVDLGYDENKPTSSVGMVLVQRMCNIDILSSLFWRRRPLLPLSFWLFSGEEYQLDSTTPSFQETTGCPLWVISVLAAISHLDADVQDGANENTLLLRAMQLERDLANAAQVHLDVSSGSYSEIDSSEHLDTVCECYYWSAVILLQRRIFEDSRDARRVQFSLTNLINLIDSLPLGCGPDTQLSLPLYVAAQAATSQGHRDILRNKSTRLNQIYPLKMRSALTSAFEDMWTAYDAQTTSNGLTMPADPDPMKENSLFIC